VNPLNPFQKIFLAIAGCVLLFSGSAFSHVIYVNYSDTSGIEDGTLQHPFNSIQESINASISGDTVLVYPGTYVENVAIENKTNLTLGSLFLTTGDTSFISHTIIDGGHKNTVVSIYNGTDLTTIISGFTIANGYAVDTITNVCGANGWGGGIGIWNYSSSKLLNLIIKNNIANVAPGILVKDHCSSFISNVKILNNIEKITICCGGAGIGLWDNSTAIVVNTLFAGNISSIIGEGGAIISCWTSSSLKLNNLTVVDNSAASIIINLSDLEIKNSILWHNSKYSFEGTANILYSDIQGGYAGIGNINKDPLFVDATKGNYHLQPYSQCINTGTLDTTGLGLGLFDMDGNSRVSFSRIDMGAYEFNSYPDSPPKIYMGGGPEVYYFATDAIAYFYQWYYNGQAIPGANNYYYVANKNFGTYYLEIKQNGFRGSSFSETDTLSINSGKLDKVSKDEKISAYPNPAQNTLNVTIDNDYIGIVLMTVMDITGRPMYKTKFEKTDQLINVNIPVAGFNAGYYLLELTGSINTNVKFLKK